MSMDPETGAIKAWVGGLNHKFFKYDHVKQSTRQPGSTFKPFVYGTAIGAWILSLHGITGHITDDQGTRRYVEPRQC